MGVGAVRYTCQDELGNILGIIETGPELFLFAGLDTLSMTYNREQLRRFATFPNSSGTRTESYTSLHGVIQSQFSAGNLNNSFYRGYEYDDIGRIKRVLGEGVRRTYSYDNLGRLTSRVTEEACAINGEDPNYGLLTGCGFTAGSEGFSYDQVGNRTDLGGVSGTGNRIQSFNGITFQHDADGNVTSKYKSGVYNRQYWWSAEARLDSAYQDSWSKVKYDYDALGRPVRKWRGDPNGWVFDRLWVYDGDHRLVSLDPGMNRVEEYAYAPGIDRPIATIRGNTGVDAVGYHVQDQLGNILGIIENGAYISQTNSYDAWGTPTETGHAYNNQLKWKGLKWEGDVISLYYMRNRWYDSETGRFMSEDPIGLAGGINLYAFAGNDPVNGWDPSGLRACPAGYSALGYLTVMGSNGEYWCIPPAVLLDVEVNARAGGWSRGDRGSGWTRGGGDGPGGDLGGPGGGGGNGSESAKRPLITRECISASAMLAITGVTDFTVVGPAARAGVQLGARAFTHVVSGLSFDVIRGAGYISKNQHRRLGGTAWGMASGYSSAAGIRAHTVANEAVGTVDLGLVSGDLSGWDFVPYLATLRSLDRTIRTCL